ncbi:MAG TPA: GntR family transcriptional regulator [Streptosporangiaceae bacterium]|nr:GntR family transcriptional regulator [Streptosporangiaceae bacterium]
MTDPMYRQIAGDLRRQIEAGKLPPGSQLPTEIELREEHNASRNTIRDAIKVLTTRGLVETRPGQGTFVVERISPFVTTLTGDPETASGGEGRTYSQEVQARLRSPNDTDPDVGVKIAGIVGVGVELQLGDSATIVSRHQQRFIDGTPWSLQTSYYPMRFVEQGATRLIQAGNIEEGTVDYLRESLGIKQAGYRDKIIVRAPDQVETRFFRLPDDGRVSVIETRRTAYDDAGTPVRLTVSVYPADRNQFALDIGKVPREIKDPQPAKSGTTATAEASANSVPEPSG